MLFNNAETFRLNQLVAQMAKGATAAEIKLLEELAPQQKPPMFDAHSKETAIRYNGNAREQFEETVRRRYPMTHDAVPKAPLNLTRFVAAQDAGVYELEPVRSLVDEAGDALDHEDPRVEVWADWLEAANLVTIMPEVERRTLIPLPTLVHVGVTKRSDDFGVQPRITLYWPHDVIIINHWSQRTDDSLDYACVVAVKQAAPDGARGAADWWLVWSRETTESDAGEPSFGPWTYVLASTKGDHVSLPQTYDGTRLPFVLAQVGETEGYVWVDEERDLKFTLDEVNILAANEQFCIDMQGHSQPYTDSQSDSDELTIGADRMLKLMPGANVGLLDFNPKLEDMRKGRMLRMKELAAIRRNSPDAYNVEKQAPESGVSRRIGNRAHEAKLNEVRHVFRQLENTRLLPILMDLLNVFSKKTIAGATPRMNPRIPSDVEDPTQRQTRLVEAMHEKGITEARTWTEAGYYPSIEDAVQAGLSDELKPVAPVVPPGSTPPLTGLAARLASMRAPKPEAPPEEPKPLEG